MNLAPDEIEARAAGLHDRDLSTGSQPMLTMPAERAELLLEFA